MDGGDAHHFIADELQGLWRRDAGEQHQHPARVVDVPEQAVEGDEGGEPREQRQHAIVGNPRGHGGDAVAIELVEGGLEDGEPARHRNGDDWAVRPPPGLWSHGRRTGSAQNLGGKAGAHGRKRRGGQP